MKRTIKEWEKELGVVILDPDGFDRTDPKLYKRRFTEREFIRGLIPSTIQWSKKFSDKYFRKELK